MINVDSSLQLYTLIVSWKYYAVIWNLLVGTGIVFIPIVMALVGHLFESRRHGSMLSNEADGFLSGFEVRLAQIFVVMFFIAMPLTPLTLDSGSVQVVRSQNKLTTPDSIPAVGVCNSTGTPFDDIEASDGEAICGTSSPVPIWWYGVLRVSHAITQATVNELTGDTNQGFRALVQFMRSGKIKDAGLQNLSNIFEAECYETALARNQDEPGNNDAGFLGRDIYWQGSDHFVGGFYMEIVTDSDIPGIAFQADNNRDVDTRFGAPAAGKVNCLDFWVYLENLVFLEAVSPVAGDDRAGWWTRLTAAIPGNNNREVLVRQYIQNSDPQGSETTESINRQGNRGKGTLQRGAERLGTAAQAKEFVALSFRATFVADALVKALPILQAYILMFMVFMLPFGFVISGYSWDFVIRASVLLFFVTFWSAIWGFASWIDDSLARALWPGDGDGIWSGVGSYLNATESNDEWQQGTNKLIHSMVTAITYLLAPVWGGWILASAGVGNAAQVGAGTTPLGSGVGSGGGAGAASGIGSAGRIAADTAGGVARVSRRLR